MGPCEESPTPHSPALLSYPFTNGIVHKSLQVVFSVHTAVIASFLPVNCSFFGAFNLFSDSVNDRKKPGGSQADSTRWVGADFSAALLSEATYSIRTIFLWTRGVVSQLLRALFPGGTFPPCRFPSKHVGAVMMRHETVLVARVVARYSCASRFSYPQTHGRQ